jgi:hypothetical protein
MYIHTYINYLINLTWIDKNIGTSVVKTVYVQNQVRIKKFHDWLHMCTGSLILSRYTYVYVNFCLWLCTFWENLFSFFFVLFSEKPVHGNTYILQAVRHIAPHPVPWFNISISPLFCYLCTGLCRYFIPWTSEGLIVNTISFKQF